MLDTTDVRSEGDEGDENRCAEGGLAAADVVHCQLPVGQLHLELSNKIELLPDDFHPDAPGSWRVLMCPAGLLGRLFALRGLECAVIIANELQDGDVMVFMMEDPPIIDHLTRHHYPVPVFGLCVLLVFLTTLSNRYCSFVLPKELLGVPGTTLTLRHMLRVFLPHDPRATGPKETISVAELLNKMNVWSQSAPFSASVVYPLELRDRVRGPPVPCWRRWGNM